MCLSARILIHVDIWYYFKREHIDYSLKIMFIEVLVFS